LKSGGFAVTSALPLEQLLDRVAAAPAGSLVIYIRHSQDERGQAIDPLEVLDLVSRRSAVPVYGLPRDNLGHGIVGGYGTDYEQGGLRSAQAAIRILRGERVSDIPSETIQSAPMFDWRQLQRWKVSDVRLPAVFVKTDDGRVDPWIVAETINAAASVDDLKRIFAGRLEEG
jgi:hypothetical protein